MPMNLEPLARHRPAPPLAALPVVVLVAYAALLAACAAPSARPASLMDAYAAVDAARSDRKVRALAPAGLHEAETALAQAFRAWQAGQPEREVNQLAHLARQRAFIARSQAVERRGRNAVEILPAEAQRHGGQSPDEPIAAGAASGDETATVVPTSAPLLPAAGGPVARPLPVR